MKSFLFFPFRMARFFSSPILTNRNKYQMKELLGTHSREGIVQVVNSPGNDHNVIDI